MKASKATGANGHIDLTDIKQFALNSKIGNSMKEA
jgi:hypothetical protein